MPPGDEYASLLFTKGESVHQHLFHLPFPDYRMVISYEMAVAINIEPL
jgi:hypothetical protein